MGLSLYDEHTPYVSHLGLTIADTVVTATLCPASELPRRIDSILCLSTAAGVVTVYLTMELGGVVANLGRAPLPIGSGITTVPMVDLILLLAPATIGGLVIPSGWVMKVGMSATLGAGEQVQCTALGGYV
jgi:hypothetical protein